MEDNDPEILSVFFMEADEHTATLTDGILRLEKNVNVEGQNMDLINSLFRAFHSLKGASGMLGFARLNQLTHASESLLDLVRSGKRSMTLEIAQVLLDALDGMTKLLEELKSKREDYDLSALLEKLSRVIESKSDSCIVSPELQKYLPAFIDNVSESLAALEAGLLKLDQSLQDAVEMPSDLIHDLFRNAHTIKGAAGTMNFKRMMDLSHAMESLMDKVREGSTKLTTDHIAILFRSIDTLKLGVQNLQSGQSAEVDIEDLLQELGSGNAIHGKGSDSHPGSSLSQVSLKPEEQAQVNQLIDQGLPVFQLRMMVSENEPIQGLKAFIVATKLKEIGKIIQSTPAIDEMSDLPTLPEFFMVVAVEKGEKDIREALQVSGVTLESIQSLHKKSQEIAPKTEISSSQAGVNAGGAAAAAVQTVRVDVERLDRLCNMSGELVIIKAHLQQIDGELRDLLSQKTALSRANFVLQQVDSLKVREMIERPENSQFKNVFSQVTNEMTELISELEKLQRGKKIYQNFQKTIHQMDLTSSEIQRAVMEIRMVPVRPLFGRFKRVVRDIARDFNKELRLILKGEDTEIDKKMVDELVDPLTHLVRNAADHGIEVPEARIAAGKPAEGTITLNAFHQGNHICVTVSDDGKGLDIELIRKKAVEKGIYSESEASALSQKEIELLIFHPGFSTAKSVTSISGRGVGMDIVKKKLEELRGSIEIESTLGKGTTFTILLPLTLAIQKSLICEINYLTCAIPLESVLEITQVSHDQICTVHHEKVVRLREKVIPIQKISQIFDETQFSERESSSEDEILVILANRNNLLALKVDRLFGEQEIVVKSLSQNLQNIEGISGASILGNGRIALILDVSGIMSRIEQRKNFLGRKVYG